MLISLRAASALLVPLGVLLLAGSAAQAQTPLFANLTNSQENPPAVPTTSTGAPRPASFGTANFTLSGEGAQTTLTFSATVFNIDFTGTQTPDTFDNLTAAHIHAGPNLPPGNNPVVWGFFGMPFNDTNPTDRVVTPFVNGVGGTIVGKWDATEGNNTTLIAQLPNILSGRSYINFHTVQFPGGEVRGQITVVPEPGSVATGFALAGTLALGIIRARRRKA